MKHFLYPERNRLLLKLSVLQIISILVIARYSSLPALPGFFFLVGPIPQDTIPYDIAMGYFASYIFYLIQVYFPQRNREIKSLKTLENYLKSYLRYARLFHAVLQDYEFTTLHKNATKMPAYRYIIFNQENFIERFSLPNMASSSMKYDGIYNFLLKAKTVYDQMVSNPAFSTIDSFLMDQISSINMTYWFETYEKLLLLYESGYGAEIQSFREDDVQWELIQKLKIATDKAEEYLNFHSMAGKARL